MRSFTIPTRFTAQDGYSSAVARMTQVTQSFASKSNTAIAKIDRGYSQINKRLSLFNDTQKQAIGLAKGLIIAGGIMAGSQAFLDLDKNVSAAAAKFGVLDRETAVFTDIRNKAIEMGATTEFTSGQAAEALKNMATAGFTAQQAITGINSVLDLATATQQELSIAADVSAKSLAAFGLRSNDPKELQKNLNLVNDTLNKIITTSGFGNLEEFTDVIAQSGSNARQAGVDIRTWGAVVASSVSEAVPASTAGTRFANMLSYMSKNLDKFNKLGVQVADNNGNYRDFIDIMKDVEKVTAALPNVTKSQLLFDLFGERGSKMAASILANGVDALYEYRQSLIDADGVTKDMAGFMRSGLSGAVNAMKSGFEAVAISIGDVFQPEIDASIKRITEVARGSKEWIQTNKELIKTVATVAKWVGISVMLFKTLGLIISFVKGVITTYNIALGITGALSGSASIAIGSNAAALTAYTWTLKIASVAQTAFNAIISMNPIALVFIAIAALIAVVVIAIKKYHEWGAALLLFMGPLGQIVNLIQAFRRNWDMVTDAFKTGGIKSGIIAIGKVIYDSLLMPLEQVMRIISNATGFEWANTAMVAIQNTRQSMGVNTTTDESGQPLQKPVLNSEKERQNQMREVISAAQISGGITLTIDQITGKINAESDTDFVTMKPGSTWSTNPMSFQ